MVKTIALTQGFDTIVDDEDFAELSRFRWKSLVTNSGVYAARTHRRKFTILMHRVIMNPDVKQKIDHKDGDTLNNRRLNLRICNSMQNSGNTHTEIRGVSKYRGVYWNSQRGKWQAQIGMGRNEYGEQIVKYLGRFSNEEDAAKAYDKAAEQKYGEFARLNLKPPGWIGPEADIAKIIAHQQGKVEQYAGSEWEGPSSFSGEHV